MPDMSLRQTVKVVIAERYRRCIIPLKAAQQATRPKVRIGWGNDGELTLADDWLTLSGLLNQPLMIDVLPGRIIIRAERGLCWRNTQAAKNKIAGRIVRSLRLFIIFSLT